MKLWALLGASLVFAEYAEKCTTRYFTQPMDHFGFVPSQPTYKQRALINLQHHKKNGPIFFYLGNEAPVELYVEHSGLMWENAERFGAALVFAEHRGYGKSQLCDLQFFTTEQAMGDFAVMLDALKLELHPKGVVGFGGSYGGMLATAFRFHYPHLVDGVIAGSAPVLSYEGMIPKYDSSGFAQVVTRDAGPKCAKLVKKELKTLYMLQMPDLRRKARQEFKVCNAHGMTREIFMDWVTSPWDYLAMGDFPFPSSYVQPNGGLLPGYPVKAACDRMEHDGGLKAVVELFYNATKDLGCFPVMPTPGLLFSPRRRSGLPTVQPKGVCHEGSWDYQYCTNHLMPFSSGTSKDMFYPATGEFDVGKASKACEKQFGVRPNLFWARQSYGGLAGLKRGLTNVVFSNGLRDPWSAGGVLDATGFHPSVKVVLMEHGAHHSDLMFSNELDTPDIKAARVVELKSISVWLSDANVGGKEEEQAARASLF